jgi:hypothetical protein
MNKENKILWMPIYILMYILVTALIIIVLYNDYRFSKNDKVIQKVYEKQSTYVDSIHVLNSKIFWLEDSINYLNQEIEYYEYTK